MADGWWFRSAFEPLLPFQPMYLYVASAYARTTYERSVGGTTRRADIFRSERRSSWNDYQASLRTSNIPDDAYYRINRDTFEAVWFQCVAAWGSTTVELRRHAFDVRPRSSWVVQSRTTTFRRRYAYHLILIVQGRIDKAISSAHQARLIVEYDTLRNTVNMAARYAAGEAAEWRNTNSDLWTFAGNVTSIVKSL